jgi:formate dehydrogenase maturation protein FdhE
MNWESLLNAYPSEKEAILQARSLRKMIIRAMHDIDIPVLHESWQEKGLLPLAKTLRPVCTRVWTDYFGSAPSFDMQRILEASAQGKTLPKLEKAETGVLELIINDAFSLLFQRLRIKNSRLIPGTWDRGYCPFCSTSPHIAFDSDFGRELVCPMCGHSWRFPRFKCPACRNADPSRLGYFEAEGSWGIRVYFCRECRQYIKVVDRKVRTTQDPETEDTLSIEMDELATQEGFRPYRP